MTTVLILYYSRHGSTAELARCIAGGVEGVDGCEAVLRTLPPVSGGDGGDGDAYAELDDLEKCDALILGSPTRFGTVAAPLKIFFEKSAPLWMSGALAGKPAAVFTAGGSQHGGQESTLLTMMLPLLHHGMLIVGIPFAGTALADTAGGGTPYGASHVAGADNAKPVSVEEKKLAEALGQRVARVAVALGAAR